jgi:polysaccharide pyruvyl transferase WcaK-like protein
MKATIIGWYGTETLGDRAILAGIISVFNKSFDNFEIKLGSLFPFFSDRTITEDYSFYKELIESDVKIDIFDSKNIKVLDNIIKNSDFVLMGGGPLMDLNDLFMVEYAFKKAKKKGVKTALLGCGIGPLFHNKYRKSVFEISRNSDLTILRDNKSKEKLENIYKENKKNYKGKEISASFDPAVECALEFKTKNKKQDDNYIAVNLREFPLAYTKDRIFTHINQDLKNFIRTLSNNFKEREINLIPMHYFHIGGDDRAFLNSIALDLKCQNIKVQNENLNLKETIKKFQNAYFNVGMRFHSVVIQTMVSGKNYVLDYTEPKIGKIVGFLDDIDPTGFYNNRYISLQGEKVTFEVINNTSATFSPDYDNIRSILDIYVTKLKELVN